MPLLQNLHLFRSPGRASKGRIFDNFQCFVFLDIFSHLSCFLRQFFNVTEENLSYRPRIEEIKENIDHKHQIIKSLESKLQSKIIQQEELYQVNNFNLKAGGMDLFSFALVSGAKNTCI